MDLKVFFSTFALIFLAELGDKTQLATFSFAAESQSRLSVFLGSAGALVATSLLAVLFGAAVSRIMPAHYLRYGAGGLFVLLGLWVLIVPAGK